ncbi:MAG: hypothetical protein LQ338_000589 [Usnochroma carphineum]|nr:MAG: hypothetical protein LQ338_000589 [Usnochroma carphineum]
MTSIDLARKVDGLSDLELALLLSFVANEHCLIETEEEALKSLGQEVLAIASNTFSRTHALIDCSEDTTLDEFTHGLLIESTDVGDAQSTSNTDLIQAAPLSRSTAHHAAASRIERAEQKNGTKESSQELRIADVVILKNLSLADYEIQIQALELIRSKRIYTNTAVYTAPKCFCVAFIQEAANPPLNKHLIDHIFMSHYHDPEDGFANLEAASELIADDGSSSSSVVRKPVFHRPKDSVERTFSEADIQNLVQQAKDVTVTAEVKQYLQNIVTFLRLHRAVDGGITPRATKYFDTLVKCLAPLHGLEFVTPPLVDLAARKVYPHRIVRTVPDRERSLQYGSDLAAVTAYLEGVTPESIVEDVLASVETPL